MCIKREKKRKGEYNSNKMGTKFQRKLWWEITAGETEGKRDKSVSTNIKQKERKEGCSRNKISTKSPRKLWQEIPAQKIKERWSIRDMIRV